MHRTIRVSHQRSNELSATEKLDVLIFRAFRSDIKRRSSWIEACQARKHSTGYAARTHDEARTLITPPYICEHLKSAWNQVKNNYQRDAKSYFSGLSSQKVRKST